MGSRHRVTEIRRGTNCGVRSLALLAIAAIVSVWRVRRVTEIAPYLFGPELGPNIAAGVIGILIWGLVTYFVIDQIQSRRERRRCEADIRSVVVGVSRNIRHTAMFLTRIARGKELR